MTYKKNSLSEAFLANLKVRDGRYGYRELDVPYQPSIRQQRISAEVDALKHAHGDSALQHFQQSSQGLRDLTAKLHLVNNHYNFAGCDYRYDSPRRQAYYGAIESEFRRQTGGELNIAHQSIELGESSAPVNVIRDGRGYIQKLEVPSLDDLTTRLRR